MSTPNPDTFVDGCGVVEDAPLGEGVRIRFKLEDNRQQDISVYVEDGILHVVGQYRPLVTVSIEDNHVDIATKVWSTEEHHD